MGEELSLGKLLGRREAFNMVAARCSAADALLLRQMRDERLYLGVCADWEEFCVTHLHMRKSNANRIIALLNEFGPQYFEIAQLTRISPETYRAIAPSIRDGALHTNGEAIALIPENAEKVAAAVAEIRRPAAKAAPEPVPVASLRRQCKTLMESLAEAHATGVERLEVLKTITELMEGLRRLTTAMPVR